MVVGCMAIHICRCNKLACDRKKYILQANGRCRWRSIHRSTGTRAIDPGPRPHGLDARMADTCASASAAGDMGDAPEGMRVKFFDWLHIGDGWNFQLRRIVCGMGCAENFCMAVAAQRFVTPWGPIIIIQPLFSRLQCITILVCDGRGLYLLQRSSCATTRGELLQHI